jgi:polyferredoxin
VDIIFAGVLGFGVYFFLSGRVWCRFFCPLAALMHIYSRFSRYRIFSDKKKCISCNICTKVCHMGIDVMNYANKGIPMNDVECVSCSACIVNCPTQVLSFGLVSETDTENKTYRRLDIKGFNKENWLSGM